MVETWEIVLVADRPWEALLSTGRNSSARADSERASSRVIGSVQADV